ncbi:retrotransposon nucleocapsid protein [Moniliophthora roreri MCA 2997]|uniref:Retrotransposon nucleocapsid protein n=2 Tax=Moniliophthora roreri TaxID=221103 RepID=V2WKS7_MONRO|nr:retrotransposon nucleocapsid protein [Moniliophthora roreri MCA 2997]
MVIRFWPGRLGAKPDALTRRWDVYPKEGDTSYVSVNPQNLRPIFTEEQLISSLRATYLEEPVLRASVLMDIEKLHSDIRTALPSDPEAVAGMQHAQKGHNRWTIDDSGLLRLDNRIFVPLADDLCLQVCKHHHDHVLASHFGQNRTLAIIRRSYTWPRIWDFVKDYVRSCTDCGRNKLRRHQPYRMLKPLPVPT